MEERQQMCIREVRLLQMLQHPNVVKLYDVFRNKENLYFVFEYLPTDLEKLVSDTEIPLNAAHVKCLMQQLLECVAFMHSQSVLHRVQSFPQLDRT